MDRPKNVINEASIAWTEEAHGDRNAWKRKKLGAAAGAQKLGCSLLELPPGKRSFPLHWHVANEESLYVLSGRGKLRLGSSEVDVGPGDYVALRCDADHARQLVNDGQEPLRYLAISTMIAPDVVFYPESSKLATVTGRTSSGSPIGSVFREGSSVDYWDGEE
jgi:uncharacterized cupin superfamily protein